MKVKISINKVWRRGLYWHQTFVKFIYIWEFEKIDPVLQIFLFPSKYTTFALSFVNQNVPLSLNFENLIALRSQCLLSGWRSIHPWRGSAAMKSNSINRTKASDQCPKWDHFIGIVLPSSLVSSSVRSKTPPFLKTKVKVFLSSSI